MTLPSARTSLLFVVSSSCQLYSGTGTALFDWIGYARDHIDVSLLIDSADRGNFEIAERFCRAHGIRLHPSEPATWPGCPDRSPRDTARIVCSGAWDFVECVSWASAATNLDVLSARSRRTRLLFTPHTQPLWTLPEAWRYFMVPAVLRRMLAEADLVFLDSPDELAHVPDVAVPSERAFFVPLGVDTARFAPVPGPREPVLFSVFDFREHRKRPDLLIRAFEAVADLDPAVQFTLAGKGSDTCVVSPRLASRLRRAGYLGRGELQHLFQTGTAFVLLSDYEAFGLPIAEALCCGTPVVITRQDQTARLFGDLPGVHLVDNTDTGAVAAAILSVAHGRPDHFAIARAAAARFAHDRTYGRKLARILEFPRAPGPKESVRCASA